MSCTLRAAAMSVVLFLGACSLSSGDDSGGDAETKPLKLTIAGPASAPPGVATTGFKASLTRGGEEAVADVFVTLTASKGTIDAPPDKPGTGGANTGADGDLAFVLHVPADVVQASTIVITGKAEKDGESVQATYSVGVNPDAFQFIEPLSGATAPVGIANALPLKFQWTHAAVAGAATGVSGNINLSAGNTAFFVVNNVALPAGQVAAVRTNADGQFSTPIAVASNQAGQITVTAVDAAVSARSAQVVVQFTDSPSSLVLDADTLSVSASPAAGRFSTLSAKVYNQSNQAMPGAKVLFTLAHAASSSVNERVSPLAGTTGSDGIVTTKYEAGPANGTATVQACVEDTEICDSRDIQVQGAVTPP